MYLSSPEMLASQNIALLPRTLGEAIDAFEADPLSEAVMGPLMYKTFINFKRNEWMDYQSHVSDWEINRYLRFF
jgi:glutamine synthetase